MLEIGVLGGFRVRIDGREVPLASRPAQLLLAYLVLHRDPAHRRDHLAAVLWPDAPEDAARQNLRSALWKLQSTVGPGLVHADKVSLRYAPTRPHVVDVEALEGASTDDAEALAAALEGYRGPLLPGALEEWVLLERDRLQALFEAHSERLVGHLERADRPREVVAAAERWLALAGPAEPAFQALMRAHAALGDRAGAVAAYRRCVEALRTAFDIVPAPESVALLESLQGAAAGAAPHALPSAPSEPGGRARLGLGGEAVEAPPFAAEGDDPPPAPLAGRASELEHLLGVVRRALEGGGGVALVLGEAGAGKTSLLRTFAAQAVRFDDALVVPAAFAAIGGGGDPLLPFRIVLERLTGGVETAWRTGALSAAQARRLWGATADAAAALVEHGPDLLDTLVPADDLARRVAAHGAISGGDAPQVATAVAAAVAARARTPRQHDRLFDEVGRVLVAIGWRRPVVLVLDDLHWADATSLQLLFHLARALAGSRVALVAAARPVEPAPGTGAMPLARVVAELLRSGVERIDLDLPEDRARDYSDALLDREPNAFDDAFRRRFFAVTGGHSLFATELLADLEARGDIVRDAHGRLVVDGEIDWHRVPPRVEGLVRLWLERLDPELHDILATASVEGVIFTLEAVAAALGLPPRHVAGRLSSLAGLGARLVEEEGIESDGGHRRSRYRFRHGLFRDVVHTSVGPAARALRHEAIGDALERLHDPPTRIAARLAWHFGEARLPARALPHLRAAGVQALRVFANRDAASYLRRALDLVPALPPSRDRDELELDLLLDLAAPVLATQGFATPDNPVLRARTLELSAALGRHDKHFRVLWHHWIAHAATGRIDEALAVARELELAAAASDDPGLKLQAHHTLWFTHFGRGDFAQALAHVDAGLSLYDPVAHADHAIAFGGHDPAACGHVVAARCAWYLGDETRSRREVDLALAAAAARDHPGTTAHALVGAAETYLLHGDAAAAREAIARVESLAAEHHLGQYGPWSALLRGAVAVVDGDVKAASDTLRRAIDAFRAGGGMTEVPIFMSRLAVACLRAGRLDEARRVAEEGIGLAGSTGDRRADAELELVLGVVAWREGRLDEARSHTEAAVTIARRQGAASLEGRASRHLAAMDAGEPA